MVGGLTQIITLTNSNLHQTPISKTISEAICGKGGLPIGLHCVVEWNVSPKYCSSSIIYYGYTKADDIEQQPLIA